jgi:RNA polymerase primary sigma factor
LTHILHLIAKTRMRQLKITQSITNRESASLEKYLQDIGKEEMVSPQEEVRLAQLIKNGDKQALDKLTRANLRFVVSVAKQYQNQGLSLPDLINEGNLGLIKAAQRFDETKGFKFISYAVWWIRQSILQAIAEQSRMVRLPLNQIGAMNKVRKAFSKLEQEYQREPSADEISEVIELTSNQVSDALRSGTKPVSVDAPFDTNEDSNTLLDVLENADFPSTDSMLINESLQEDINRSLSTLSKREGEVIKLFFGIGTKHSMSLEEIGAQLNLTRERVRQIKETAIRRLKHNSRNRLLKAYL